MGRIHNKQISIDTEHYNKLNQIRQKLKETDANVIQTLIDFYIINSCKIELLDTTGVPITDLIRSYNARDEYTVV